MFNSPAFLFLFAPHHTKTLIREYLVSCTWTTGIRINQTRVSFIYNKKRLHHVLNMNIKTQELITEAHSADSCSEIQTWCARDNNSSTWLHTSPSPCHPLHRTSCSLWSWLQEGKVILGGVLSWCNQTATSSIMRGGITAGYNGR